MKKIAIALLLLVSTITFGQEKVLLRLNYKKGDKYQTHMKMKQDMGVMVMDMEMTMEMFVEAVKDKKYDLKNNFTFFSTVMEQGGEKMVYNSKMKDEELSGEAKKMASTMKPLLETTIFLNMDDLGNSKLIKLVPEVAGVTQLKDQMSSVQYPKEQVSVGSTWVNVQKTNNIGMEMTYTVTEITKDYVLADITGKVSLMPGAKIGGKLKIDRTTGIPSYMNMKLEAEMMGVTMKMDSEVNMKKI
ncbi:hypothetical protein [Tenacibaculum sp. 190524A05c]|uniref:hypothetical protein n=1 Tax=Tenacibaculum platacis TaxID=3137852 RepID=UPI0032B13F58